MYSKALIAAVSVLVYAYAYSNTHATLQKNTYKNKDYVIRMCVPPNASLPIKITCSAKVKSPNVFDNLYWLECNHTEYHLGDCSFLRPACCDEHYRRINRTRLVLKQPWDHELRSTLIINNDTNIIDPIFKCVYRTEGLPNIMINITKFINESDHQGYKVCKRYNNTDYNIIRTDEE
ncbi:hypothetical protein [Pteropox virus]|uniref:Uncharacterized protein n=1 Tax=Pteropox virus TaxID=1873698 RepID=A0A1B1MRM8_9POXV|nr:hypothetical protein [Pteropox virus]ANS71223.1 hypothetical protein [Pteropox virus]